MVICFNCPSEIREIIDSLLGSGEYRDDSEVITTAIRNLAVLHADLEGRASLSVSAEGARRKTEAGHSPQPQSRTLTSKEAATSAGELKDLPLTFPSAFSVPAEGSAARPVAKEPDDVWASGQDVPVERWLFGQYNRLLPAKASCRALASLLGSGEASSSIEDLAAQVAADASRLGSLLAARDTEHGTHRDDALATAFPASGPKTEKGVLRYANQFVATVNSNGQLSGLLVALKLVNWLNGPKSSLCLTQPGWDFASLPNPVLDDGSTGAKGKFSEDEIQFMLEHIRESVPAECFAYRKVLEAIESGSKSPESLDSALAPLASKDREVSSSFISTQRSGAVSRMSDLGLVARERSGVRIEYRATDTGRIFLSALNNR